MHEKRRQNVAFLLASSSVRSKHLLCFIHNQGQKSEQTHSTKKFVELHNRSSQ